MTDALLVRWKYGYTSVVDDDLAVMVEGDAVEVEGAPLTINGGATDWGYLELGSVETEDEAERIATAELNRTTGPRDQISAGADPNPVAAADAVFSGWTLGDYVNVQDRTGGTSANRVLQISISEDDNGTLTVLPELSTLLDQREVRWQRTLNRMTGGDLDGSSAVASPIVTPEHVPARRPVSTTQTFSWPQTAILNYRSAPWTPEVAGRLAQMHLRRGRSSPELAADVSGALHVAFIVNGVTLDEGIIHDGDEEGVFGGTGVDFRPGDRLELQPTIVPAGAVSLTARVIQTHYH